jgi:hypothetical protein
LGCRKQARKTRIDSEALLALPASLTLSGQPMMSAVEMPLAKKRNQNFGPARLNCQMRIHLNFRRRLV